MRQNLDKEKRVQHIHISIFPPHVDMIMISSIFQLVDPLNLRIAMSFLNFFDEVKGNAFVNKSVRLLYD